MHGLRRRLRPKSVREKPVPPAQAQAAPVLISNRTGLAGIVMAGVAKGWGAGELPASQPQRPAPATSALARGHTAPSVAEASLTGMLVGHADSGSGAGPTSLTHPTGAVGRSVSAVVHVTTNEPEYNYRRQVDIAADHDAPTIVGWTTPRYALNVTRADANSISIAATLDFEIELAEELTGPTARVLEDHEHGHVGLATAAGELQFGEVLEADLEGMPFLAIPAVQRTMLSAAERFETWDGALSWIYDRLDYPRMREAYLGADMPLADLAAWSPRVAALVEVARDLAATSGTDAPHTSDVLSGFLFAAQALSRVDRARLGYNPEFKALVAECDAVASVLTGATPGEKEPDGSGVSRGRTTELRRVLGGFTWTPPGA